MDRCRTSRTAAPHQRASCSAPEARLVGCRSHRGQRRRRGEMVDPGVDQRLFVSADAGETWDVVPVDAAGNGQLLFVMDERLVFAVSIGLLTSSDLFVSNSASDWSRLEGIEDPPNSAYPATAPNSPGIQRRPTWSRLALQVRRRPIDLQHGSERLVVDPQPPRRIEGSRSVIGSRRRGRSWDPPTTPKRRREPARTAPLAHRTRHHRHRPRLQTR